MSTTIDGVRITDMPDLGAFTSDSSLVGEHSGSGRFSASGLSNFFLPLTGGDVTGRTTISDTITTPELVPSLFETTWHINNTGGVNTTCDVQTVNNTYINTAAGQSVWSNRDTIFYSAPTPSTSFASYVPRVMNTIQFTDRGSGPTAPQIWGAICGVIDETGHASSVSGNAMGLEVDVEAALADDADLRNGLIVVGVTSRLPGIASSEFSTGVGIFAGDSRVTFKKLLAMGAPFSTAGIDFRSAISVGDAPAIWLATDHSIAFDTGANLQLRWSTSNTRLEFQWLGNPAVSIDPSGNIVTTGGITAAVMANFNAGITFQGGVNAAGTIFTDADWGCLIRGRHGINSDVALQASDGTTRFQIGTAGIGFNGVAQIPKPSIIGARAGNTALASLLTELARIGLVTDSTTA